MTFESIFIPTLLLANLTVPSQALQAFGFHLVRNILWGSNCNKKSRYFVTNYLFQGLPSARGIVDVVNLVVEGNDDKDSGWL
jgi:hypothetical protein